MSSTRFVVLAGVLLVLGGQAMAGFIDVNADFGPPTEFPGRGGGPHGGGRPPWAGQGRPDWAGPPDWAGTPAWARDPEWHPALLANGNATLDLDEALGGGGQYPVDIGGNTDADPVLSITKDVENSSGFVWYGYSVELETDGDDPTFVAGSASSSHFNSVIESDNLLIFWDDSGGTVPVGETLTIVFDILIETVGGFNFTLTQTPLYVEIPEPATLGLLAIGGGLVLLRRRRK